MIKNIFELKNKIKKPGAAPAATIKVLAGLGSLEKKSAEGATSD